MPFRRQLDTPLSPLMPRVSAFIDARCAARARHAPFAAARHDAKHSALAPLMCHAPD